MRDLSKIYLVTEKLERADAAAIAAAESALGTRLPIGYARFLTTLGRGVYCGLIRVCAPAQIAAERAPNRALLAGSARGGRRRLPAELAPDGLAELIVCAQTADGDRLAFHPRNPYLIYVVPRGGAPVYHAGRSLYSGLERLLADFGAVPESDLRWFDSEIDRRHVTMLDGGAKIARGELLGLIEALGVRFVDASAGDSSIFFVRDFDGEIYLGGPSESRQTLSLRFDAARAERVAPLRAHFAARGFREIDAGRRPPPAMDFRREIA